MLLDKLSNTNDNMSKVIYNLLQNSILKSKVNEAMKTQNDVLNKFINKSKHSIAIYLIKNP